MLSSIPTPPKSANWTLNWVNKDPTTNTSLSAGLRSTPVGSLSSGSIRAAVGPTKSTRSIAPRSLKMFPPIPLGGETVGSSIRNCPYRSRSGAKIGESGIPSALRTWINASRSFNESAELSMAADWRSG